MKAERTYTVHDYKDIPGCLEWASELLGQTVKGGPVIVGLGRPKRSEDQSAKFHAICGDVAAQKEYMGRMRTKDQWKVLFVSGHAIATGLGADVLPGLESEFVNLRESTAQMGKERMSSLIEYVLAYCAENEIELSDEARKAA